MFLPWTKDRAFLPTSITYGLAFVVGVIGNGLVVFALLGDKKARNATSAFLVSLAVADLLFLLVCVPYEAASKLVNYWSGGLVLCKVSGYVDMLTAAASILNLTAVSVERYVVIVHPMKTRSWFTLGNTIKVILIVWLVALLLCSPILHIMSTATTLFYNNASYEIRQECWDSNFRNQDERIAFAWYQLLIMFLLPLIVMGYCYAIVIHVLWLSTKQLAKMTHGSRDDESRQRLTGNNSFSTPTQRIGGTAGHSSGRSVIRQAVKDQSAEVREARKQVIRMLLTIIVIFLLCWGPKLILTILKRHELAMLHREDAFAINLAINLLPYLQSAVNPIIYGFMSKNFRRSLRSACRSRCKVDPGSVCRRRKPNVNEYDMDTRSMTINGAYTSRYSPSNTKAGRTIMTTIVSDI
uniref:Orphan G-protein coupled receptor 23 n=1 Tax=Platynereis dumerilii TaxID=6359 RepID=A0A0K0PUH0_PLADU|nr:orphan G-protein coupled receptor 23 [Platynereis dumerilii]